MNTQLAALVKKVNDLLPAGAYSMDRPLRNSAVNDAIGELARAFVGATEGDRHAARAALVPYSSEVLLGYAWEMAEDSVSQGAPEMIRLGLLALAIEGGGLDPRDSIIRMCLLFRSAEKLAFDPAEFFVSASSLAASPFLRQEMHEFPSRTPRQRALMGFVREVYTAAGFRYVQQPWPNRGIIWKEKIRRLFRKKR